MFLDTKINNVRACATALVLGLMLGACSNDNSDGEKGVTNNNANSTVVCRYADRLEFPKLSSNGHSITIVHLTNDSYDTQGVNFCTEWDYQLPSQRWSCYQMKTGFTVKGIQRRDYRIDKQKESTYLWDEDLDEKYYTKTDNFYSSGFDHGHICPSADRLYSNKANDQTFYMTNMQPQYNAFNAGLWSKLETQIRSWATASGCECLYVAKGATIDKEEYIIKRIKGTLIAPKYFFCALLAKNSQGYKAIAFWMLNESVDRSNDKLGQYAISVDELERRTGIDFFCNLPDDIENDRESRCDLTAWGL